MTDTACIKNSIHIQVHCNVILTNKKTLTQKQNNFIQVSCILHRGCDFFIGGLPYCIGVQFLISCLVLTFFITGTILKICNIFIFYYGKAKASIL